MLVKPDQEVRMPTPSEVVELIERFRRNLDKYKRQDYKETPVRVEFVDPFFEALGWDVRNVKGYAEQYKDVVHEDAIKVSGATRAPDYSFRIGGARKFFLEVKKPSVAIRQDVGPAYQLRRYAWSAKLPLSVLTDFEEFAVYDCRQKPQPKDKPGVGRVMYLGFEDYVDRWDEIEGIFSRESVLQGSFDRYVQETKAKRGTAEVDVEFLKEIEEWRDTLARNIALRNPDLSVHELNFSVQRTIDRIIFLRMCEDRGIESYGRLMALINGAHIYGRLRELYRQADEKYNAGLFDFRSDTLTPKLAIDDKVLKSILDGLYYPQCPYEFSVLPADVLGQVYEQFLGKVIRLTPAHRAVVEEKPEVKKAGGVYYTPTYVVDYIVDKTVGKLIEGKTPRQMAKLRILDPACGSGSFLLGAYQRLLDAHLAWYQEDDPKKHAKGKHPALYKGRNGDYRLTTAEKKRILLNNIYGVDIDRQAVEVTKLSLLLKVLEGETEETLVKQLALWREPALPDLDKNVKCGNSLIGPEYLDERLMVDDEEMRRVNPFDWQAEFPEAMAAGGFDCVIGNPPWGAEFSESEKDYLGSSYRLNSGKYESYIFFIERSSGLLRPQGTFGYIVPSYWVSRSQTEELRVHLCGDMTPNSFIILPENVFSGVKMDSCIIVAQQAPMASRTANTVAVSEVHASQLPECHQRGGLERLTHDIDARKWLRHPRFRFNPRITESDARLILKMEKGSFPLNDIVEVSQGLTLYRRSTLAKQYGKARADEIVSKRLFHSDHKKDDTFKKELLGRDVARYDARWNRESWVSYGPWLAHAVDERFFRGPRLVIQKLRNPMLRQRLVAGYLDDDETYSAGVLLNVIPLDSSYSLLYVLGLLNSNLVNWWYRKTIVDVSIRVADLRQVPIPSLDFDDRKDAVRHDKMVALVERMLDLHKKLDGATIPADKRLYQRQIDATDKEIDELVYDLHGLNDDEISVVEGDESDTGVAD
jgi:type I restriction-modification system DNA methylase subunit